MKTKVLILLMILFSGFLVACKGNSPTNPDPIVTIVPKVRVEYERVTINCSSCMDYGSLIYRLYDPEGKYLDKSKNEGMEDGYRCGHAVLQKIGENRFEAYLENVIVQVANTRYDRPHCIWANDAKVYIPGTDYTSAYTNRILIVPSSYDVQLQGWEFIFKIR